jgi:DNA-binding NtrC family response regulator
MSQKPHLLVIDDDPLIHEVIKAIADPERIAGMSFALDAGDGLRDAGRHHACIILLDDNMPGATGTTILPAIGAFSRGSTVIVITRPASPGYAEKVAKLGAHGLIEKPFDPLTLFERIMEIHHTRVNRLTGQ